jgi:hypothetical protein
VPLKSARGTIPAATAADMPAANACPSRNTTPSAKRTCWCTGAWSSDDSLALAMVVLLLLSLPLVLPAPPRLLTSECR